MGTILLLVLFSQAGLSQQLRLGNNPFTVEKSAVLELQSANQGLLFTRIADTSLINAMNPPDGMVVYFTPTKRLLLRANGYWQAMASTTTIDTTNIPNFYQKVRGLFSAAAPITLTNGQIGISQATTSTNGYLSSTDWNTFNNKLSTIDTTNIPNFYQKVRGLFGAGSGISYNATTGVISSTVSTGNFWAYGGNTVGAVKNLGTVDNYDLPFITNSIEKMRITNTGNVGIGTSSFDGTNPEKLLLDAGTTTSYNLIKGKGSINNYFQFNIQNQSSGTAASSDLVATANNGDESTNFVDLGINSGGYSSTGVLGGANNAYLYSTGSDFVMGNATSGKNLLFFTGGTNITNERMRIDGNGKVGIGTASPTEVVDITGNLKFSGALMPNNSAGTAGYFLRSNGAGTAPSWINPVLSGLTDVSVSSPANGQILRYNGTAWTNVTPSYLTSIDTGNIPNFYTKVRSELTAGTGISYNNSTGVIGNAGVTSLNGNTGALTMDTTFISNFYQKVRGLFTATAPITLTNGLIGISQATTSTNGYLSSTDWNTFNNKLSSIDTTNIANFYLKVRGEHTAGTGIGYNATTGVISNTGVVSLNGNTGALTMDTTFISNFYTKVRSLFSGGTGISYNSTTGVITASGSASGWSLNGNTVAALKTLGTVDNYDLPVITNNTERMRITNTGNVGIGTSTFDGTNPEKLLVHAGTTSSYNLINAKGTINNYLQLNIQNLSSGAAASSDVVATANNGSESVNFVDMGINSSGYSSTGILGGADNAYLYSAGNDFVIGNSTANKNLIFFTGGSATTAEQMRIDANGHVGIGVTDAANPLVVKDTLEIRRTGTLSTLLFSNTAGTGDFRIGGDGGDIFWQGGGGRNLQMGSYWPTILMGDRQSSSFPSFSSLQSLNTGVLIPAQRDASVPLAIQGNSATQSANLTEWRNSSGTVLDIVDESGSVAIGTSTFDGSNPEKLLVDAGTTSSFNVISGKGTINNYLQLNIQNKSTGNSASSDVVATADNGSESVNFIDMGINSSGYSTSGVLGGANTAYLYSTGNDFVIGNSTSAKNLRFFTGGTATGNERVRIDGNGNVGVATTAPTSKLDVNGSVAMGITTISTNLTLDETNYSVIITGGTPSITLPTASTCSRRIYVIVNQTAGARTTSAYRNFSNASTTTVAANSSITIQSDGTNWYRIQ